MFDLAGHLSGESAYGREEDGAPFLVYPWDQTAASMMDVALSLGASHLFQKDELQIMRQPFEQTFPKIAARLVEKLNQ